MTDKVIFRRWKTCGHVIALFPDIEAGPGLVQSYEHVGQHGAADYLVVMRDTVPAKVHEYADLWWELEKIGYKVRIMRRRVRT